MRVYPPTAQPLHILRYVTMPVKLGFTKYDIRYANPFVLKTLQMVS